MRSDSNFEKLSLPSIAVVKTTPKVSHQELFSYKKCYIGISLDNPGFYGKSLQALVLWAIGNFDQCLVVVGDYLRRFNEQIFNGSSQAQAAETAYEAGEAFMEKAAGFFAQIPDSRLNVTRWKPCLQSSNYRKSKDAVDKLFATEPEFMASVERDAYAFVRRQTKRNRTVAVSMAEAIELSSEYLLEEIAVFSALSQQGWKVELYPGPELRVLVDIAKGQYTDIPRGLKERINVELKISGIGTTFP